MIQDKFFNYALFNDNISKIGLKIQECFVKNLYNNLEDKDLISIYNYLESYWFDSFRSSIIWLSNEIVGGSPESTIKLGLIMSMVGSGIGIHDDIIDKTRFKGSRKTVQELFGLERALVAGDLLLIKGLFFMAFLLDDFEKEKANKLIDVFQEFFSEMAVAEMVEIRTNKQIDLDIDDYYKMLWKLGVDVQACAKLGAISGNAIDEQIEVLSYIGSSIGYINRLNEEINDILNIKGNLRERIKNESIPLALVYAAKSSDTNYKIIKKTIYKNNIINKELKQILKIVYEVNAIDYIKEEINKTYYKAKKRLEIFPESYAKKMLTWCLYYIVNKNDVLLKSIPFYQSNSG